MQFWEQDGISMLSKVTFWVESRLGNQTLKSQEISQYLYNWSELFVLPAPLSPQTPLVPGLRTCQVLGEALGHCCWTEQTCHTGLLSHSAPVTQGPCHWALLGLLWLQRDPLGSCVFVTQRSLPERCPCCA